MRRDEFIFEDKIYIESFLNSIEFGVLAISDKDCAYAVPISFCFHQNELYFHGAKSGRKYQLLKNEPRVSFNASKPYSYIPSSFLNHTMIPTQFFFSVYIEGKFEVITENQKKRQMLEFLVKKYENRNFILKEGQENGVFTGIIKAQTLSAKAKFGQNLDDEKIKILIKDLKNRGNELDFQTIKWIEKLRA